MWPVNTTGKRKGWPAVILSPDNSDEMATNNMKDGWETETTTRKIPNTIVNSKIPTKTWPPLQYTKCSLLNSEKGYTYPTPSPLKRPQYLLTDTLRVLAIRVTLCQNTYSFIRKIHIIHYNQWHLPSGPSCIPLLCWHCK